MYKVENVWVSALSQSITVMLSLALVIVYILFYFVENLKLVSITNTSFAGKPVRIT